MFYFVNIVCIRNEFNHYNYYHKPLQIGVSIATPRLHSGNKLEAHLWPKGFQLSRSVEAIKNDH